MYKLVTLTALGVVLIAGLSACKPGVYYPFGGGPSQQYYVPAKGMPQPAPERKPGSEKTPWMTPG